MKIKLFPWAATALALVSSMASATDADNAETQKRLCQEVKCLKCQVAKLKKEEKKSKSQVFTVENKEVSHIDIPSAFYFGSTPILSAPYIGTQTMFNGSHLIVNIPSTNEDLRLLRQQQKLFNTYLDNDIPYPKNPYVEFSGKIEGQVIESTPYTGNRTSDINLSGAELDMAAVLNPWAVSFLGFVYNSNPPSLNNPPITRTANSEVQLSKGFLSIGNFNKTPVYGTIGQFVVPFGLYASNMLTPTLTSTMGQLLERAISIGYSAGEQGPYGALFTFKGDSGSGGTLGHINQVGLNIGYAHDFGTVKTDIGGGYIANIADSNGMQNNGQTSGFTGFGGSESSETLSHRVPAVDVRGGIAFGKYNFRAEYIDSIRTFAPIDLSYNGFGARPSALDVQGSYSFMTFAHPSAVAIGYGNSSEALALLIPKQRYSAAYNVAIWRHTIGTLEFHHDINYGTSDYASGGGNLPVNTNNNLGHTSQTLTAQLGVYF
ncbi:MAG: LbtU family siderophore porin [Gammaproteobacteria bacterium]|nr:LbtU family siderophore porin [Gammaproteobacteria bacterium]